MWFIRYKVKWIIPNREEDTITEEGIVPANNYTEATRILEEFYGYDLLEVLLLRYIDETTLILSTDILDTIEQEVDFWCSFYLSIAASVPSGIQANRYVK